MPLRSSDIPVMLFPLKIETRFVGRELWIRALPDEAFLQSHDPRLTVEEKSDATLFNSQGNSDVNKQKELWGIMVSKYGAYRAGYLSHLTKEQIIQTELRKENEEPSFYFNGLPERLIAYLYPSRTKEYVIEIKGEIIKNPDNLVILGKGDEWVSDFRKAVGVGMGIIVRENVLKDLTSIERIIVVGFYESRSGDSNANWQEGDKSTRLADLLKNHLYTEGLSFLEYGTPTNNLSNRKSGYSLKDEYDTEGNFEYMVEGYSNLEPKIENDPYPSEVTQTAGYKLSKALGLDLSLFEHFNNANLENPRLNYLLQKSSWFALGGNTLQMLFGEQLDSDPHNFIWEHYSKFVHARGPFPSIKIGDQPYGILPVTKIRDYDSTIDEEAFENSPMLKNMYRVIAKLFSGWKKMISPHFAIYDLIKNRVFEDEGLQDKNRWDIFEEIYDIVVHTIYYPLKSNDPSESDSPPPERYDLPESLKIKPNFIIDKNGVDALDVNKIQKEVTEALITYQETINESFDFIEDITQKIKVILELSLDKNLRVARIEDTEDIHMELQKIFSMQEHSSHYQLRVLEYDRIRYRLESWLNEVVKLPTPLASLPVGQVYEILGDRPEIAGELKPILQKYDILKDLLGDSISDEDMVRLSPLLSFGNGGAVNLEQADLKLYQDNWEAFEKVIREEKINDLNREHIIQYNGEHLSLIEDLFLRGYANAVKMYHRIVYFKPTNDHLRNSNLFKVKTINDNPDTNKAVIIIWDGENENKTISINAPFEGKIKNIYVEPGDTILAGQQLFRVINEDQLKIVVDQFAYLGEKIIEEINATEEKSVIQESALREALDLNSYRLDAWITSLATRRLEDLRNTKPKGIYFGAYGWVENLIKDIKPVGLDLKDTNRNDEGGIIHCPTPAQSLTATIFKNSFLSYLDEKTGNPFTLNLTSDRIQQSNQLMQGIRQNQSIEALLGYRLESLLREHEMALHEEIYILREQFPLEVNIINRNEANKDIGFKQLSVIDGLKAIENKENLTKLINGKANYQAVIECIEKIEDTLDGGLDALFFEAGYQMIQGNVSQSAAAMDATKGAVEPPEIEALKTRIPGTSITHQLAILFSPGQENYNENDCKAFVEPIIETWVKEQLGPMEKIGCTVEIYSADEPELLSDSIEVKLSDLGISYLDFLYMSDQPVSEGTNELELRIWNEAIADREEGPPNLTYKITETAPANCQPLNDALEVAQHAFSLLSKCRYLKSDDLRMNEESATYDWTTLNNIKTNRLDKLLAKLNEWKSDISNNLRMFSLFDLTEAKRAFINKENIDQEELKKEVDGKIVMVQQLLDEYTEAFEKQNTENYYTAFDHLSKAAKALFGPAFILTPPAFASPQYVEVMEANKQERLIGESDLNNGKIWGQERIQFWVQGLAQVQPGFETFEEWQMISSIWNETMGLDTNNFTYKVIQGPTKVSYPWVGLTEDEIQTLLDESSIYQNSDIYRPFEGSPPYPLAEKTNPQNKKYYPDGSESMVIYVKPDVKFTNQDKPIPVYGFIVDEFSDHIPDKNITTGLSFHYNAPNNEPPQAILLAVSAPGSDSVWDPEDLRDIIFDTIDLAKIRMIDAESIQKYGFVLPMTYWFNIPRIN